MSKYTDQLGNSIELRTIPKRIISLVPSQTELLYDLGLDEEVAGITKFCIHPQNWFRNKTRIGRTKNVSIEKVRQLQPDLIIANKEENVKEQISALQNIAPVWISDVNDLDDAISMITSIGNITGTAKQAQTITDKILTGFNSLSTLHSPLSSACYLIWKDPYMTIGGDTFINDMMLRAGFKNVFAHKQRYPEVSIDDIRQSKCEFVLLSSEPYPFKQKNINELRLLLPAQKIVLVDGEMFSWYGSRLQYAPAYFIDLKKPI